MGSQSVLRYINSQLQNPHKTLQDTNLKIIFRLKRVQIRRNTFLTNWLYAYCGSWWVPWHITAFTESNLNKDNHRSQNDGWISQCRYIAESRMDVITHSADTFEESESIYLLWLPKSILSSAILPSYRPSLKKTQVAVLFQFLLQNKKHIHASI